MTDARLAEVLATMDDLLADARSRAAEFTPQEVQIVEGVTELVAEIRRIRRPRAPHPVVERCIVWRPSQGGVGCAHPGGFYYAADGAENWEYRYKVSMNKDDAEDISATGMFMDHPPATPQDAVAALDCENEEESLRRRVAFLENAIKLAQRIADDQHARWGTLWRDAADITSA